MNNIIKSKLASLPDKPGVYIMKDNIGNIIYVGKAKILKNRVRSYFRKNSNHTPKVIKMVENIFDLNWIVTDTEIEALILECNLIKRHRPKYNILLKDDKTYPFIKIPIYEDFPGIFVTRKTDDKNALYFGPFAGTIGKTAELLRKTYNIRSCSKDLNKNKQRECLNYHMHICSGPCRGNISKEDYKKNINNVILFLEGKSDYLLKDLQSQMSQQAKNLEFEKAAETRNNIMYLEKVLSKQKISVPTNSDYDIIGGYNGEKNTCITLMFVRNGKLLGTKNSYFPPEENTSVVIHEFIKQYYRFPESIPNEILISQSSEETALISELLSRIKNKKVNIHCPLRGKKKDLVELAVKNAKEGIKQKINGKFENALNEISDLLSLPAYPERIEVYDISNTAGSDAVGFMTVFINGMPAKGEYRKFRIKYVEGQNDYDCMYEVIYRRLMRYLEEKAKLESGEDDSEMKFINLPDLIFVDGGKTHVSVGKRAVSDAGLSLDIFGLVKDAKHRTRDITSDEREYGCIKHRAAFDLITRMQDETHNHAVKFHHEVRTKSTVESELMKITGVGPKTRKKLFEFFGSEDKIKNASANELSKITNRKTAGKIYDYFHKK